MVEEVADAERLCRGVAGDAIYEIVEGQGIEKTLTLSAPED